MKYIKKLNENKLDNLSIEISDKSKEIYDFISSYLNLIDFESYFNNENLYNIAVYDQQKIIAANIFRMKDGKIHLNYSAVNPNYRNIGVNKLMKKYIVKFAKQNNCSVITANVRKSNIKSLKSLLNSGFNINTNYNDLKYPDGEEKIALFLKLN